MIEIILHSEWETEGITEVHFDASTRLLHFQSIKIGAFSIVQDKYLDIPYTSFEIRPMEQNTCVCRVVTKISDISIIVTSHGYSLINCGNIPELKELSKIYTSARHFIEALQTTGINLYACDINGCQAVHYKVFNDVQTRC